MDCLRSEDLKEEKNVTTPIAIIAVHCTLSLPSARLTIEHDQTNYSRSGRMRTSA
jgi:hypothetical protein